ncbi:hypothetical protein F5Y17DRAFT_452380 [Xylariaceae sp. FL0594]|nr:hypothetical protein F5Y17DRAFT_452380 [Xylariaceae sp. FL0594]
MPGSRPRPRPRRHSLSSGDESVHPHPAKLDALPRPDHRRRARLPRSKSTSAFDVFRRPPGASEHDAHNNIALEQTDVGSLRELVRFLRTTGPPSERPATHDECLRLSGSGEPRRWSLQSLRRSRRSKLERHSSSSPQSQLPENAKPGTTVEGRPYIAISTPVPENTRVDGPWFRSQYPIYLPKPPAANRDAWPQRTSSKVAALTPTESGVSTPAGEPAQLVAGSPANCETERIPRSPKPERHNRALSNRVSTDQLLRAMLNTVDEGLEHDLGASLKPLGIPRAPAVGHLAQSPQMQTALSVVTIDQGDVPCRSTSLTRPRSPRSTKEKGSPSSPGSSSRRPAIMLVQTSLAVPKQNMPPESPGFPNMLATMTFPSPPKGSRPSSPTSTAPSVSERHTPPRPCPAVQPRTSSRRACTSTTASAASLDEVIRQRYPDFRQTQPEDPLQVELGESLSIVPRKETANSKSVQSHCQGNGDRQRESQNSQFAATALPERLSFSTDTSSCSSSNTNTKKRSSSTIDPPRRSSEGSYEVSPTGPTFLPDGKSITIGGANRCDVSETEINNDDQVTLEQHELSNDPSQEPDLHLPATDPEVNSQPRCLYERRLARKAKVREYKMRDLDASRTEAADSPILGYFASSIPDPNDPSCQEPLLVAHDQRRPSTLSTTTMASEVSNGLYQSIDRTALPLLPHYAAPVTRDEGPLVLEAKPPAPSNGGLKISAMVVTDIEPICPPSPHWHTSGITLSPIMVVANLESRPGSPTLRPTVPARIDSSSPRTMARTRPLHVGPYTHNRHKTHSVTISRNPSTGAIERFALGPTDVKSNRRSLISMPTPPLSPGTTHLSRRLSLPPVQMNMSVTPRERAAPSRCQEWPASSAEGDRGSDIGLRSATLKERVMREKLQKEKEITDIVARTVGPPQRQKSEASFADQSGSPPSDGCNAETLEKRLRRLERNNDAWLCAMKPLLEAMARTLEDMRAEDRSSSLRMSDFIIDTNIEARRFSIGQRSHHGEGESAVIMLQNHGANEMAASTAKNRENHYDVTVLSPVPQEPDDRKDTDEGLTPLGRLKKRPSATMESSSRTRRAVAPSRPGSPGGETSLGRASSSTEGRPSRSRSGASPAVSRNRKLGSTDEADEASDWSDLDPLIQELGSMTRRSQDPRGRKAGVDRDGGGRAGVNGLNPLMRELMSASNLSAEEDMNVH